MPLPWNRRAERGSAGLIRVMIWLTLRLGWRGGRLLLYPITAYFFVASPTARAASRGFLVRATGRPASPAAVFRHLLAFATMLLDRVFFLTGRTARFNITIQGLDHLTAALAERRGAVLIGAHLGSFEALRAFARTAPVPVRVLMYRANAGAFSRLIERLAPDLAASIIEIGRPESMLLVHECVSRGEIVGILADRAPARLAPDAAGAIGAAGAGGAHAIRAPFLGAEAAFPDGPFRLAASLGAPTLLFFGLSDGPRRYALIFEPFVVPRPPDRAGRAGALRQAVLCYADRLEQRARAYPFNWFNFYDFWDARTDASSRSAADPGASAGPVVGDDGTRSGESAVGETAVGETAGGERAGGERAGGEPAGGEPAGGAGRPA